MLNSRYRLTYSCLVLQTFWQQRKPSWPRKQVASCRVLCPLSRASVCRAATASSPRQRRSPASPHRPTREPRGVAAFVGASVGTAFRVTSSIWSARATHCCSLSPRRRNCTAGCRRSTGRPANPINRCPLRPLWLWLAEEGRPLSPRQRGVSLEDRGQGLSEKLAVSFCSIQACCSHFRGRQSHVEKEHPYMTDSVYLN